MIGPKGRNCRWLSFGPPWRVSASKLKSTKEGQRSRNSFHNALVFSPSPLAGEGWGEGDGKSPLPKVHSGEDSSFASPSFIPLPAEDELGSCNFFHNESIRNAWRAENRSFSFAPILHIPQPKLGWTNRIFRHELGGSDRPVGPARPVGPNPLQRLALEWIDRDAR